MSDVGGSPPLQFIRNGRNHIPPIRFGCQNERLRQRRLDRVPQFVRVTCDCHIPTIDRALRCTI